VQARRGAGRQADVADEAQSVDQLADMVRLRRCRNIFQPGERRHSDGGIDSKQLVKFGDLRGGDGVEQGIRGTFAGAGAPGNGGALDHRRRREKDLLGAKGSDGAGHDRLASVGVPGGLRGGLDHQGEIGSGRQAHPKHRGQGAAMVRHRLGPAGIFGERGGWNPQLHRQQGDQAVDGIIHLCQGGA
jgi:hypothetical protein